MMPIQVAYVDPGFSGTLYQLVYFLVFGVALGWVLKPYHFIKGLFKKPKPDSKKTGHNKAEKKKS